MKILIAEDNEDSRNLLVKQLRAYGHEVMAAADGAEALEQALIQPPDIIISDIMMPNMDGYQLCRECKQNEQLKDIPFVFYTATYTLDEDKKFARSLGAATFIIKPTEPDVFVQKLSEIVEKVQSGALVPAKIASLEPSLFLTEYNKRVVAKLEDKVTQLEVEITERKRAEETLEHLNRVLRAIRGVNQLIIREKDRDRLLKEACNNLTKTRGFYNAWIAILDESGGLVTYAEAGLGEDFLPVVEQLKRGELPNCCQQALGQAGVVVIEDPFSTCGDCPLAKKFQGKGALTTRLEYDERAYGLLVTSVPVEFAADEEEQSLLREVAGDIAFALHDIELEEERKRLEHGLKERVKELQCLYSIASIAQKAGTTLDELYQEVVNFLPQSWQYPEIACCRITINDKEFRTNNYKETEWKQSADIKVHDAKIGKVEANYLEERPELDEGPFLKEERLLLDAVVERLGKITELKQAEELYMTLATNTPVGVFIIRDGKFSFVNPEFLKYIGFTEDELLGTDPLRLVLPEDRELTKQNAIEMLKGRRSTSYEYRVSSKAGETRWIMETVVSIQYQGGRAVLGYFIDITERKKMEEQLIVTDRLASVGELASGIAHELNNPLTSVIGFSDLLLDRDLPDDIKEDLEVINREAKRTAGIVRNLLTFARKHETEKKPVNINSIIEKVLELRAYEQKVSNIEVNTRFAPDLPEIIADGFQLQQVFLNIIINAEHFMIEAHNRGTLTITTERLGDIIRASFADDGPGIAKENLGHLFDPFFTTKEVGKGTGLGLSICHGIITEHGGRIYAESKLGKGATFVVELPISKS